LLDDQHWAAAGSVDTHLREQAFETLTSGDMPAVEDLSMSMSSENK
jgi:hypothetical protein